MTAVECSSFTSAESAGALGKRVGLTSVLGNGDMERCTCRVCGFREHEAPPDSNRSCEPSALLKTGPGTWLDRHTSTVPCPAPQESALSLGMAEESQNINISKKIALSRETTSQHRPSEQHRKRLLDSSSGQEMGSSFTLTCGGALTAAYSSLSPGNYPACLLPKPALAVGNHKSYFRYLQTHLKQS